MNFVKDDFAYYRRSFEQMYRSYFQRRMIVVGIALLIICAYLALIQEGFLLNLFLIAVLLVLFAWLYLRWQEVDQIIAEFEQENSEPIIYQIVEFEDYYAAKNKNGQQVRIKKNGNRNFPSANKTYTLMAGFKKAFSLNNLFLSFTMICWRILMMKPIALEEMDKLLLANGPVTLVSARFVPPLEMASALF